MAKKTVTESALVKRVNRKLAHSYERLSKRRSGEYDHVDAYSNTILGLDVDLESFARDAGVLAASERITASEE